MCNRNKNVNDDRVDVGVSTVEETIVTKQF